MNRLTSKNPLTEKEALNLSLTDLYMRLKLYEDTGFEPEEIAYFLGTDTMVEDAKAQYAGYKKRHDEYMAWKQAETEGRLIVLPCKVGDKIYLLYPKPCDHDKNTCDPYLKGYCGGYDFRCQKYKVRKEVVEGTFKMADNANIGRTVFLTREEAEAALMGCSDDNAS